jgi:uncharacterized membrane protein YtjA (UPF0391 family)
LDLRLGSLGTALSLLIAPAGADLRASLVDLVLIQLRSRFRRYRGDDHFESLLPNWVTKKVDTPACANVAPKSAGHDFYVSNPLSVDAFRWSADVRADQFLTRGAATTAGRAGAILVEAPPHGRMLPDFASPSRPRFPPRFPDSPSSFLQAHGLAGMAQSMQWQPVGHRGCRDDLWDRMRRLIAMLHWSAVFLVIALVALLLGFGGIAGAAAEIARLLFFVFLALFVVSLLFGGLSRRGV